MNHASFYRVSQKQAEKLKSREIKEGWMKNDKGWMKDDDFKLLRGFALRLSVGKMTVDWLGSE